VKALGDAVTGGDGTATALESQAPLKHGVVRWRALATGAVDVNDAPASHEALKRMNRDWNGLLVHWLDGCPCAGCVRAAGQVAA
jgi:hypothetical protein